MRLEFLFAISSVTLLVAPFSMAWAEEESAADAQNKGSAEAEAVKADPEMEAEVAYIRALIDNGYPDFAGPIIVSTKKRWPESEAPLFALEVRGLLSLDRTEDAEKKIASLPDRKGSKYWAARLEVANNDFARNRREDCMKIYEEFFKNFQKPPKDIRSFYIDACYTYGQLLKTDHKYEKATEIYERLIPNIKPTEDAYPTLLTETTELYLKFATEEKDAAKRAKALDAANKLADKLLWMYDQPVFFGRGLSMKAHVEQMRGNLEKAEELIDEYKPQLVDLHNQILEYDPEGKLGLLQQSPLPECLYLQAEMLWNEAQAEFKKAKKNAKEKKASDERVKALLFGPKDAGGKRNKSKGAFQMVVNVFMKYEMSAWAAPAGEMQEAIKTFAEKNYKAKIHTKITPEMMARARAAQFKKAAELYDMGMTREAIKEYYVALAKYPELSESIQAVFRIANMYLDLIVEGQNETEKEEARLNADAVEGYLAERFTEHPKVMMTEAGNAVMNLAAKEKERGQGERADRLYKEFIVGYRNHPAAAQVAASKAGEAQKAERYEDAIAYWKLVEEYHTNSQYYVSSLAQLSACYGKLEDSAKEIKYIQEYLKLEKNELPYLQAKMQLAQMYLKDGQAILAKAAADAEALKEAEEKGEKTAAEAPQQEGAAESAAEVKSEESKDVVTAETVAAAEKKGSAQFIRAIQQFAGFAKEAEAALAKTGLTKEEKEKFTRLREIAMYRVAESWSRLKKPEEKVKAFRERSTKGFEDYLVAYPDGMFSTNAYVRLGTIYTAMGEMEKSKDALDRLSKKYPDSPEAKNAKPQLAKSLIEMGFKREGTDLYAEMLRTDGQYTAGQYVNAGEALIEAKSWELANQAFEKAEKLAGTNQWTTIGKARLGRAKSAFKQKSYVEARDALDKFLEDSKLSRLQLAAEAHFLLVEVASEQGRTEKDAAARNKYFSAAVASLNKVRNYWQKKERWEQDKLDLLSGDVLIRRIEAEEAMGLKEEAKESCGRAASKFQVFIQAHGVTAEHPLDKMLPGEVKNLEYAYARLVPLFTKMGAEQAERVITYGQQYLDLFPNGKSKTEIINCMNQAKADLPTANAKAAAAAEEAKAQMETTAE